MKDPILHAIITDELASLERMLAILRDEQHILTSARIDQLDEISAQKNRAAAELELLDSERRKHIQSHHIPDEGKAITAWLEQYDPNLLDAWNTLIALAKEASHYNTSNGQLIASREEANRSLMKILIAERDIDSGYSADGRLSHSAPRRPLDRA